MSLESLVRPNDPFKMFTSQMIEALDKGAPGWRRRVIEVVAGFAVVNAMIPDHPTSDENPNVKLALNTRVSGMDTEAHWPEIVALYEGTFLDEIRETIDPLAVVGEDPRHKFVLTVQFPEDIWLLGEGAEIGTIVSNERHKDTNPIAGNIHLTGHNALRDGGALAVMTDAQTEVMFGSTIGQLDKFRGNRHSHRVTPLKRSIRPESVMRGGMTLRTIVADRLTPKEFLREDVSFEALVRGGFVRILGAGNYYTPRKGETEADRDKADPSRPLDAHLAGLGNFTTLKF